MKVPRAAAPSRARREIVVGRTSDINRIERIHHIFAGALVAGARTLAGDIEIHNQPALESDGFEDAVAAGEVDLAVAQVEDTLAAEDAGLVFGRAFGIFIVREHQAVL